MIQSQEAVKKALSRHQVSPMKPAAACPPPDPYDSKCPTRLVLDRIADKWTVLVLGLLCHGPIRFNRLRREIDGLTQKMLSQTLKGLERDGLIARAVKPTSPVTVEYSITPLGGTLAEALAALQRWAGDHIGEVAAAQSRYDAAARSSS